MTISHNSLNNFSKRARIRRGGYQVFCIPIRRRFDAMLFKLGPS